MHTTTQSLKHLKLAYITAFSIIGLVIVSSLAVNQVALYREGISREAAAIEARQSIRSQQIGRDNILLVTKGNHAAIVADMATQLAGLQADRTLMLREYVGYYPQFAQIDHGHAAAVYSLIVQTAEDLIRLEREPAIRHAQDRPQEYADITRLFYRQPEQLANIQTAQGIIEDDSNSYIATIRTIDYASSLAGIAALLIEAFFVLVPAVRLLDHEAAQAQSQQETAPWQSVPESEQSV